MDNKEIREILESELERRFFKIREKCRIIASINASDKDINDLNKLIQKFLEIKKFLNKFPYDEN